MAKQITEHAHAARLIRAELKKHGIKASVRSSSYSGGSSIRVALAEDYLPATVEMVKRYCDQYQMGHFNGMEDIYEYSNTNLNLPQVKFVFVEMRYSEELKQDCWGWMCKRYADLEDAPAKFTDAFSVRLWDYPADMQLNRELNGTDKGGFWATRKEHVKGAA